MRRDSFDSVVLCHHLDKPAEDNTIYLWGDDNDGWGPFAALFKCPCGCGEDISLVIQRGNCHPRWDLTRHEDGTVTLAPSILRTNPNGCRSHFFIRKNRIVWI